MKTRRETASEATTHRLSLLLRSLRVVENEGIRTISSQELARRFGLNSAQIRKDLALFGEFGVRGVGYRVPDLKARLLTLMGLDRTRPVVIVGAGNLGQAMADSRNFNGDSFRVVALFDVDGRKIGGKTRSGVPILDASQIGIEVPRLGAEIGVVAVPAEAAARTVDALARAGVKAMLSFAPTPIVPPPGVTVKTVDLTLFLESLSFQLG